MSLRFRDMIRQIADDGVMISLVCKVIKVDKDQRTCDCEPVLDEPDVLGVRYSVTEGESSGVILNPLVGSFVIVSFLDSDQAFVSLMTEFDSVVVKNEAVDLKEVCLDLLSAIKAITVSTPAGQSGTPINQTQFVALENKINQIFE